MTVPALQFDQVSKSFAGAGALSAFSLTVSAGDCFGLAGANGAGKTTLLKCLLDFCEVDGGGIAIFGVDRAEDKPAKIVAAAKIFFPGLGIVGHSTAEFFLFVIGELEPKAFENSLCDPVLQRQNVTAFGVDTIAPEDLAGQNIEQLRRHAELVPASNKSGGQHRVDPELASRFARIDLLSLIFRDDRTRADDEPSAGRSPHRSDDGSVRR